MKANVSVTITNSVGAIYEDNIQIYGVQEKNLEQTSGAYVQGQALG